VSTATLAADNESLAAGKLLVASRDLRDPNFSKSVVLLTRYGPHGAMGLVVNRPSNEPLSALLPEIEGLEPGGGRLFRGGPVQRARLVMLLRSTDDPDAARRLFDDVFISEDKGLLEQMVAEERGEASYRVYSGSAGWAPGQLEHELARGDWHVLPAEAEVVFHAEPGKVWSGLVPRDPTRWVMALPVAP